MIQKFILRFLLFVFAYIVLNSVLLFVIPKDNNAYLCEYNKKVHLLKTIPQPRMIFVGGSNIAFGIDSKIISDSLNVNVVDFGLHGGIGIRIPFEDCLNYVHKGDIVIAQFEYEQFNNGGYGGTRNSAWLYGFYRLEVCPQTSHKPMEKHYKWLFCFSRAES